jgi:prevent-host-death family protein
MAMTFSLTTARSRLGELVNRAVYGQEPVIITEHGREVAAIISMEELTALRAATDAADLRLAQRVAASHDPGVPHDAVMAAMDALDAADHATPDEAERILAPHADLLHRAAQAEHLLGDHQRPTPSSGHTPLWPD